MSEDLHDGFERLREEDRSRAPSFRATVAAAERRRGRRPVTGLRFVAAATAVAAVMAALALGVVWVQAPSPPRSPGSRGAPLDLAATRWHGPTDFLLRLPGGELLRTLPKLGLVDPDRRTL